MVVMLDEFGIDSGTSQLPKARTDVNALQSDRSATTWYLYQFTFTHDVVQMRVLCISYVGIRECA